MAENTETTVVEEAQTETPNPETTEESEKVEQSIEMSDTGPCVKHVRVTVPRTEIDRFFKSELKKLIKETNVPGFRPGKTPRRLIEKKYHDEAKDSVKAKVLGLSLQQIDADKTIEPISEPELNFASVVLPDEGDFVYEFDIEVRPEFSLPDYREIQVVRKKRTITDADVDAEIEAIRKRFAKWKKSDQGAKEGDVLVCDVRVKVDDVVTADESGVRIRVGQNLLFNDGKIEGFARQMIGVKNNESRVLAGTLSTEIENEAASGKPFSAEFVVDSVMNAELPELNEEFFKSFDVGDLGELKDWIRTILERRVRQMELNSLRQQVVSQLLEKTKVDLPRNLLRRQTEQVLRKRVVELSEAGHSEDDIRTHINELRQRSAENTAYFLREQFLLEKIAEQEKIESTPADFDAEIDSLAEQYGESSRRVKARIERDGLTGSMMQTILERKAIEKVLSVCQVTNKESTEPLQSESLDSSYNLRVAPPLSAPENADL